MGSCLPALKAPESPYRSIRTGSTHDEINRIERELDQDAGKLKKAQSSGKAAKHQSFDAVVATSGLLVVVALAIVFGGHLNDSQRAALTGGVLGGAGGSLTAVE